MVDVSDEVGGALVEVSEEVGVVSEVGVVAVVGEVGVVSVVGVVELTRMAQDLAASTYRPLPLYAAAGALYVAIDWTIAGAGAVLERRSRWGRA